MFDQFLSNPPTKSIAGLPRHRAASAPPRKSAGITYSTTPVGSHVRLR
jgi:hypothetical protein